MDAPLSAGRGKTEPSERKPRGAAGGGGKPRGGGGPRGGGRGGRPQVCVRAGVSAKYTLSTRPHA